MNTATLRRSGTAGVLSLVLATTAAAQVKADPTDFIHDIISAIFTPNWNISASGGVTTTDQFLLQRPSPLATGERALNTNTGWNAGVGVGVDVLLRMGFRANYTYTDNTMQFTTSNGDGSHTLDLGGIGTLKSHVASVEIVKYMLPARALFTPYATAGLLGAWWVLDGGQPTLNDPGGSSQFRWGGLVTFGFQSSFANHWGVRLEASKASIGSPFSGRNSFTAPSGWTMDEPTSVGQTDYRLAGVYYFALPKFK